ncbi:MAG: non-canonical purine NTP pyrophosphatase [Holophagales bacterium]|nr:non-canonical purine NTP pyrophosphatase [Holophagales bacterium]
MNAPVARQPRLPHLERGEGPRGGGAPRAPHRGPDARDSRDPVPRLRRGRHGQGARGCGAARRTGPRRGLGAFPPRLEGLSGSADEVRRRRGGGSGLRAPRLGLGRPAGRCGLDLGLAWPGALAEEVVVASGRVAGSLAPEPRGANGFGWDVIFVPEGETRTFAEMSAEEKNARSHRARAFAELVRRLSAPEWKIKT